LRRYFVYGIYFHTFHAICKRKFEKCDHIYLALHTIDMCWSSSRKCRIFFCAIEMHRKRNISAECEWHKQYVAKSIATCKKNSLYNQPKPYFFQRILWSKFWIDFNKLTPKHSELSIFWLFICSQHVAKSIATCKKNPYIINQNRIFSKNYCEVISG
jgi:hypothetical protein